MSDEELDRAVEIVARDIVSNLKLPDWEDYPEIGENDWELVVDKAEGLLLNVSGIIRKREFLNAYSYLEDRADHD